MTDLYTKPMISADSHVLEPADLWTTRLDMKWRADAPRITAIEGRVGDFTLIKGLKPRPLAFEGAMADQKAHGGVAKIKGFQYSDCRPGGWDPDERLKDQDLDGVSGEVIYPNIALHLYQAPDAEYRNACFRAYNDWLAEHCRAHPQRLKGAAILPDSGAIEWAVAEAQRAANLGLTTVCLPSTSTGESYNLPYWDPLWAALQDLNLVAGMHLGGVEPFGQAHGPGAGGINISAIKFDTANTLRHLVWGGAPMRFPKLKWALVEGGIGWIAAALQFMDHWWEDHKGWMEPRLPEPPSFYFRRQFYATFEADRAGILTRELIGIDNLMWGSDYPHTEGVWPFSRQQVARTFANIPEADTRKIVHENVARVYGFSLV